MPRLPSASPHSQASPDKDAPPWRAHALRTRTLLGSWPLNCLHPHQHTPLCPVPASLPSSPSHPCLQHPTETGSFPSWHSLPPPAAPGTVLAMAGGRIMGPKDRSCHRIWAVPGPGRTVLARTLSLWFCVLLAVPGRVTQVGFVASCCVALWGLGWKPCC